MTEPPRPDHSPTAFGGPDPTRDIRLPPLPDRPPAAMPREWAASRPVEPAQPPSSPPKPGPMPDEPTDQPEPTNGRPRERTLAFASPEMAGGRPAPTVGATPRRPRRWPWVVLTLLPVLVIAGAGIALLLLLRGG